MEKYYFTFGFGMEHANRYVVIEATDISTARDVMFNHFGPRWSMVYTEDEWTVGPSHTSYHKLCIMCGLDPNNGPYTQAELYRLTELKLN